MAQLKIQNSKKVSLKFIEVENEIYVRLSDFKIEKKHKSHEKSASSEDDAHIGKSSKKKSRSKSKDLPAHSPAPKKRKSKSSKPVIADVISDGDQPSDFNPLDN